MRKFFIFLIFISLSMAIAASQDNNTGSDIPKYQPTAVFLDMKNKTGHLVYKEEYYVQNGSGVKLERTRKYFDSDINISRIKLTFNRPLDKKGVPYEGSMIKAIAILDNKTILNEWYRDSPKKNAAAKKTSEFKLGIMTIVLIFALVLLSAGTVVYLKRRKKTK